MGLTFTTNPHTNEICFSAFIWTERGELAHAVTIPLLENLALNAACIKALSSSEGSEIRIMRGMSILGVPLVFYQLIHLRALARGGRLRSAGGRDQNPLLEWLIYGVPMWCIVLLGSWLY